MNRILKIGIIALLFSAVLFASCGEDDSANTINPINNDMFQLEDQLARPAISAVFVTSPDKDTWNTTITSSKSAAFAAKFNTQLLALNPGYSTNLLGLDSETFTGVLANDVLTVATTGPTTYFDGTNVLTGRNLVDDVITVSLTLVFGGPDGTQNPGLSDDNVSENDKEFLTTFPYLAAPH